MEEEKADRYSLLVITLPRAMYNVAARIHNNQGAVEKRYSLQVSLVREGRSDSGRQPKVYNILSNDESSLLQPPAMSYGGSIPAIPPSAVATLFNEIVIAFPHSMIPVDLCMTPSASRRSMLAARYIQLEDNTSMHAVVEDEEGVTGTVKRTHTQESLESDSDEPMIEVDLRKEEPYMTPTTTRKQYNKGKSVVRPQTPKQPIPNMPQTPSRRILEADWAKPAEEVTNENGAIDLEESIGECLRNTDRLSDCVISQEKYDMNYSEWCGHQAEHLAASKNGMDMGLTSNLGRPAKLSEKKWSFPQTMSRRDGISMMIDCARSKRR